MWTAGIVGLIVGFLLGLLLCRWLCKLVGYDTEVDDW